MWLSRPLMQRVEELVRRNLHGTGLTVRMRAILEILEAQGALSVPDIARALHIQRQYVQVMVNEVIAADLAEKVSNPRHRASPLIGLTQRGQQLVRDVLAREQRKAELLSEAYSDEEIVTALSVVEQLCAQLDADAAQAEQDTSLDTKGSK
jgi:DNA-binding MarR family transcriptional regulator